MSAAFDNHALAALRAYPGKWHCMPCWASAADLNSPEDVTRLRALARHAGSCDRCGTVVKDDVLVREGTGGSARATLLE